MAVTIIRNQPIQVKFNKNFTCDDYTRMQLVEYNDFQKVQVLLSPNTLPRVLSGAGWTVTGGMSNALNTLTAAGAGTASKVAGIGAGKKYQIQFDVLFSTIDNVGGYRVKINNQWLKLPDATGGNLSVLGGTITCWVTINGTITDTNLVFEVAGAGTSLTIKNISIGEMSKVGMSVLDENLQEITNVGQVYTQYIPNSPLATINVIWSDLHNAGVQGKCYLYFYDALNIGMNLLVNPTFTGGLTGWTSYQWGYDNLLGWGATYDGTGSPFANQIWQDLIVPGGAIYRISFKMYGSRVYVIPTINGAVQPGTLHASVGATVKTQDIDLSSYSGYISLRIAFQPEQPTNVLRLSNCSFGRIFDAANVSNLFDLQERHKYTLKLYGKCKQAAFGFDFFNFDLTMRVKGYVLYKEYPDTTEVYNFSNETSAILNADANKNYEVTIRAAPEYHHDAIRLMRLCDTFTINNNGVILEGPYDTKPTMELPMPEGKFMIRNWNGLEDNSYSSGRVPYGEFGYAEDGYW